MENSTLFFYFEGFPIENIYFPSVPGGTLTYVGKTTEGESGIKKLLDSDPFLTESDDKLVTCSFKKIGILIAGSKVNG